MGSSRDGRQRRRAFIAAVAVVLVVGMSASGATPATLARFNDAATSSASWATDTLVPPTGLAATGGSAVTLTWTPTVDTYATGYTIYRATSSGGPFSSIGSVTPRSAATTADSPGAGTWWYVARSIFQAWTSVPSNAASATVGTPPSPTSTTVKACTSQAAETSNAGKNNGYESNPARVCADDGSAAVDGSSGTGGGAACGSGTTPATTKDQHRFWGYAFGLPGTVQEISGITVWADLGMNNNGGTTNLCVQLSPDAGATWTTIKSVAVSGTGQSAYTFGGATDDWGRTWSLADLAPGTFRVRVIDVSTMGNKDFELDFVGVVVSYYP